jgi:hypothetical protein
MGNRAKVKKIAEDIRPDTREAVEGAAFESFKGLMDKAFALDGMRGVYGACLGTVKTADEIANVAEEEKLGEDLARATVAAYLMNEFFPKLISEVEKLQATA